MRKTKIVTITRDGRDKGKVFLIREMSSYQAEMWATRAAFALRSSTEEVSEDLARQGAIALIPVALDLLSRMHFADARDLMAEMMECVRFVPAPNVRDELTGLPMARPLKEADDYNDGDIEEVATRLQLRSEVIEIHTGFSIAAALSRAGSAAENNPSNPSPTPTSRPPSASSSVGGKRPSTKRKQSMA